MDCHHPLMVACITLTLRNQKLFLPRLVLIWTPHVWHELSFDQFPLPRTGFFVERRMRCTAHILLPFIYLFAFADIAEVILMQPNVTTFHLGNHYNNNN